MNIENQIIAPVVALVAWSMIMWVWMYATRIPAVRAAKMKLDSNAPRGEQMSTLPPNVRWKADNYDHYRHPHLRWHLGFLGGVLCHPAGDAGSGRAECVARERGARG